MPWEYRVFFPAEKNKDFDVFLNLQQVHSLSVPSHPEIRSDLYIDLQNPNVGLKKRHGTQIEVKLMTHKDPSSGVESWSKVIATHLRPGQQVADALHCSTYESYLKKIRDQLLNGFYEENNLFELRKRRKQVHVDLKNFPSIFQDVTGSVILERAEVEVYYKSKLIGNWISICAEDAPAAVVKHCVTSLTRNVTDLQTCGYPEFVAGLAKQLYQKNRK